MQKKFGLIIIVVLIVGFVFGLGVAYFVDYNSASDSDKIVAGSDVDRIVAGIEENANEIFADGNMSYPFMRVSGEVVSVDSDRLSIKISPPSVRAIVEGRDDVRIVLFSNETEIVQRTQRPEEEFLAEEEAFFEALDSLGPESESPEFPSRFIESQVDFSEINVGDSLIALSNDEIGDDSEFNARRIIIR